MSTRQEGDDSCSGCGDYGGNEYFCKECIIAMVGEDEEEPHKNEGEKIHDCEICKSVFYANETRQEIRDRINKDL
jgi:hypothetical protein